MELLDSISILREVSPKPEFLYADDLADACVFSMTNYNEKSLVDIGTEGLSIKELAELIKHVVGFESNLVFNISKPDRTRRKLMDVTKLHSLGWAHSIQLREGIQLSYEDFLSHEKAMVA